ncbi:SGNH/GDSL hydrolase family protein [Streptomyces gardneri]|uniref:SGNH/GDSL hydrolase family protein n=1 Tax=Nocardia TaxID=1817 RepID=UPI0013599277|nr:MULTISPECIES: SGNH/GDSL hydrolase family protein [Nocardia]MBF6164794.1 SGNH/GDSL hydrolase family protein [Streptomyces gardneri]MBF6208502.1 SGNH/GDSL hydrolase family protein [Streptomyces gardneri]
MSDNDIRTEANDPLLLPLAEQRRLLADAPWQRYAVLGDSIAQGVGDPSPGYEPRGWADRVAAVLAEARPGLAYLNTGRIGATSDQVLAEQLPAVLEFRPDLVHLTCGGNDLFLAGGDLTQLRTNLDTLFGTLARTGAQVVTFTLADVWEVERMAPMRPMRDRMAALNDLVRELAARYDALLLELWDHPLRLREDLMSADLIHFSMSGHAVLASDMVRMLAGHVLAPR